MGVELNVGRAKAGIGETTAARDARARALRFILQCCEKHRAISFPGGVNGSKGATSDQVKRITRS